MNWKSFFQKLLLRLVNGGLIIIAMVVTIQQFEGIIEKAIEKDTTEIRHEFQTEIKKLKTKNGEVDLTVSPKLDSEISIKHSGDTLKPIENKRKGIFKRLFGNKNKQ